MTRWKFPNLKPGAFFKNRKKGASEKMLTQHEFNVVYEFLDRVTLSGHKERSAMNAVLIRLQENTEPDRRHEENGSKKNS